MKFKKLEVLKISYCYFFHRIKRNSKYTNYKYTKLQMDPSCEETSEPVCKKAKLEGDESTISNATVDSTLEPAEDSVDPDQESAQGSDNTSEDTASSALKPLTEVEAGITEYANTKDGFSAILKQR